MVSFEFILSAITLNISDRQYKMYHKNLQFNKSLLNSVQLNCERLCLLNLITNFRMGRDSIFSFHPSVPEGKIQTKILLGMAVMNIMVGSSYYIFSKAIKK